MAWWIHLPLAAKIFLGAGMGAGAGVLWYRLVGCRTGTCLITRRWYHSAAYGAFVGLMFALS